MPEVLDTLAQLPIAVLLRQSVWAYPLTSAAHIFSLGMIIGAIVPMDLRLLGLFRDLPVANLARPLIRVAAIGVALALFTGFALFTVQPGQYVSNTAFLLKLVLVGLAIVNALLVRFLPYWRRALIADSIHPVLRLNAALSLLLWTLALVAGRWIAFV